MRKLAVIPMHEHAYIIGRHLIWVKKEVGHGKFLAWLEQNVWFGPTTASHMMRFAASCVKTGAIARTHKQLGVTQNAARVVMPSYPNVTLYINLASNLVIFSKGKVKVKPRSLILRLPANPFLSPMPLYERLSIRAGVGLVAGMIAALEAGLWLTVSSKRSSKNSAKKRCESKTQNMIGAALAQAAMPSYRSGCAK